MVSETISGAHTRWNIRYHTAREIFREFPQVKEELWGGELWGDGYYVRTVGNEVTAEVIREYIKKQGTQTQHKSYEQLRLF